MNLFLDKPSRCLKSLSDNCDLDGVVEFLCSFDVELLFDFDIETNIFWRLLLQLSFFSSFSALILLLLICFNVNIFQSSKF